MREHVGLIAIIVAVAAVTVAIAVGSRTGDAVEQPPRHASRGDETSIVMSDVAVARLRCDVLERSLAADPDDPEVKLELADSYVTAEQYRKAARIYTEILDDDALGPVAHVRLALVRYRQGRRREALTALETAVERWPELQEAHYQLAVVAFAHQDLARAVAEWGRAAGLDPDSELGRSATRFVTLLAEDEAPGTATPEPTP